MKRTPDHLLLAVGMLGPLAMAVAVFFIVPRFRGLFANFGVELPLGTQVLLATFQWWGLLALLPVAVWWLWPTRNNRGAAAAVFGCVSAATLFLFCLFALHAAVSGVADAVSR